MAGSKWLAGIWDEHRRYPALQRELGSHTKDAPEFPVVVSRGGLGYARRMPRITVCIDVSDLERATAFYCNALGCTLRTSKQTHHTLDADGTTVHLSLKAEGTLATPVPGTVRSYTRHWTPVHVDFDVEDVDAVAAEVERFGGHVEEMKRGGWGAAAFCADPFGNGFCLLCLT